MTMAFAALFALLSTVFGHTSAEPLRVPAATAYLLTDGSTATVSARTGVTGWHKGETIAWFGTVGRGELTVSVALTIRAGDSLAVRLSVAPDNSQAVVSTVVMVGTGAETVIRMPSAITVGKGGPAKFVVQPLADAQAGSTISALILDGSAMTDAHFNLKPRRNAASVHLRFPIDSGAQVVGFYNEVTAVEDPVTTYYMATGFARGYFGMQVNSKSERRIIFSVWDAAEGKSADNRSTVAADNQTQLIAKGDGVEASVFGNEGTGGHSHLVYNWKTGSTQRFYVTAKPDGSNTIYTGYWYHPDKKAWMLIASFRAPKDGGWLRSLYSFSEDFGDETGYLRRKALFGPQWIKLADGSWHELTTATFSYDATGKSDRLDRFMGLEGNRFFLSHGGFIDSSSAYGEKFVRAGGGKAPVVP